MTDIIRILKENKKLIFVSVVMLISGIIIGVGISAMTKTNSNLYEKSREGILKEDYLNYNAILTIKISVKEGDRIHWHFRTWDDVFRIEVAYRSSGSWQALLRTNQPEGFRDTIALSTKTLTVEFKNVDDVDNKTGYIKAFVIVYDEGQTPDCPLC